MNNLTSREIRKKYLEFFKSQGHQIIPSASLVPENDPTVLFTTAGMHPLVPYLLGEKHPLGKRLVNSQKCVRTQDIDEVGDNRHDTFFEMLGNWSLGDYFKREAVEWSWQFMTDPRWLGLNPKNIYVTAFAGDADAPRDEEVISVWQEQFKKVGLTALVGDPKQGVSENFRIFIYGKAKNWWGPAGQTGPCGPDTEMFIDTGKAHDTNYGPACHPNCDCGRFIEIWNDVFMQYYKAIDGTYTALPQQNVDTGMGLERVSMISQGVPSIFETDLFVPIMEKIRSLAKTSEVVSERILADHLRTATFMSADGVVPSNLERGYILRRLIRKAIRHADKLGIDSHNLFQVVQVVIDNFKDIYSELASNQTAILENINSEVEKFGKTLARGLKEFEKMSTQDKIGERLGGKEAFVLFATYGFPLELTKELAKERKIEVDERAYWEEFTKHQELSRTATEGKFKGGLADHSAMTTKYHTTTHLLLAALRQVLGTGVVQKGSNITAERLRLDFAYDQKMTPEQLKQVESIVNQKISEKIAVTMQEMSLAEAKKVCTYAMFDQKYGERVKVYTVGDHSIEICGGPHIANTGELGHFKIIKEEASSAGVRRIKAILE
ncbi:MAG: alanine--tRNA ligase [Candidatus Buchananbacteria bacterium]